MLLLVLAAGKAVFTCDHRSWEISASLSVPFVLLSITFLLRSRPPFRFLRQQSGIVLLSCHDMFLQSVPSVYLFDVFIYLIG